MLDIKQLAPNHNDTTGELAELCTTFLRKHESTLSVIIVLVICVYFVINSSMTLADIRKR